MVTNACGSENAASGHGSFRINTAENLSHNNDQPEAARPTQVNAAGVLTPLNRLAESLSPGSSASKKPQGLKRKSSTLNGRDDIANKKKRATANLKPARTKISRQNTGLTDELAEGQRHVDVDDADQDAGKTDESGPDTTKPPLFNLREIIENMMKSASLIGLQHYVNSGRQYYIRVGTICSGTDAPLHVMKLFGMLKNEEDQQVFTTINAFGCEIEPFKQAFLLRNSKPQYLFRDAEDFAVEGAKTA